ncbi:MAG: hypothetical protein R3E10_11950 [Gemmatimonadota bacterium]
MVRWTAVAVSSMALLAIGCGRASERSAERMVEEAMRESGADAADVDVSEGRMRISSEQEGRSTTIEMGGGSLPEGFPDDVPIPPGAQIAVSMMSQGEGASVTLTTDDSVRSVYDYYLEHLVDEGWEIDQKMEASGMFILHATKDERELAASIAGEGDETTVTLTVSDG